MLPHDILLEILAVVGNQGDDVTFCRCTRLLCRPNEWTEKAEEIKRPIVFECRYLMTACKNVCRFRFDDASLPRTVHVSIDNGPLLSIEPEESSDKWYGQGVGAVLYTTIRPSMCLLRIVPAHPSQKIIGLHSLDPRLHLRSFGNVGVRGIEGLFSRIEKNDDISRIDFSHVTSMKRLFEGNAWFNGKIENWNTRNVTDMSMMFRGAASFNQPLAKWNTSAVTDMSSMFDGAKSFNQPLDTWDTGNVTDMISMFNGAASFNQPLDTWDTGNVTSMSHMFQDATSFNQMVTMWNFKKVSYAFNMFHGATAFKWKVPALMAKEKKL